MVWYYMNALNPLYVIVLLLFSFLISLKTQKIVELPRATNRYSSIDGLRGYAAFFVFIHHSSIWYFYLKNNTWVAPSSHLYNHLGQTSVAFFFMITGFLFSKKIINTNDSELDWLKLFISRILRLSPLYIVSISVLVLIAFFVSKWQLNESMLKISSELIRWYSFTILGGPDINGAPHTSGIIAGVTWSLKYEWFFYLSLPLLSFIFMRRVPTLYLVISAISMSFFLVLYALKPEAFPTFHLLFFVSGIIAAFASKNDFLINTLDKKPFSLIALGCIALTIISKPSAYSILPLALLTIAFCIMVCGNTLFGILTTKFSRHLGEISYSIYLTHGIILFLVFYFVIGYENAKIFSPTEHWLLICGITPILMVLSSYSYKYIESPPLKMVSNLTLFLKEIKK